MTTDDRVMKETGLEARIAQIVLPSVDALGFRLVRVRISGQNGRTLQVMAERPDGTLTIEDCEAISHAVGPALDIEDPIGTAYNLEISSPGIDRPLVRLDDFARWSGHEAKLETGLPIDGRRRFRGQLLGIDGDKVGVRLAEMGSPTVWLSMNDVSEARLVMTDALIEESLRAGKKAAAQN